MPTELGNLMKIGNIVASDNLFEGKSSSQSTQCQFLFTQCAYFEMISTVTGQIPDEITNLWGLGKLNLDNNCKFHDEVVISSASWYANLRPLSMSL